MERVRVWGKEELSKGEEEEMSKGGQFEERRRGEE